MSITLQPPISTFIEASNAHDAVALAACFTSLGTVADESNTHRGPSEIQAWASHTFSEYNQQLRPLAVEEIENGEIVKCEISGNFGDPISQHFVFRFEYGKIVSLEIRD